LEGHLAQQELIEMPQDFRAKLMDSVPSQDSKLSGDPGSMDNYLDLFPGLSNHPSPGVSAAPVQNTSFAQDSGFDQPSVMKNGISIDSSLHSDERFIENQKVTTAPANLSTSRSYASQWFGWVAAAACLVIAAGVTFNPMNGVDPKELAALKEAAEQVSPLRQQIQKNREELSELREVSKQFDSVMKPDGDVAQDYAKRLYAEMSKDVGSENVVRVGWTDGNGKELPGDVVWDKTKHVGVMRLATLPGEISPVEDYQLWIFDDERRRRKDLVDRVGGAVFRLDRKETFILIQSPLKLLDVSKLAITIEPKGGVVQSKLEKLSAISKVGK